MNEDDQLNQVFREFLDLPEEEKMKWSITHSEDVGLYKLTRTDGRIRKKYYPDINPLDRDYPEFATAIRNAVSAVLSFEAALDEDREKAKTWTKAKKPDPQEFREEARPPFRQLRTNNPE